MKDHWSSKRDQKWITTRLSCISKTKKQGIESPALKQMQRCPGSRRGSDRKAVSSWRDHAEPEECCRSRCRCAQSCCFGRIRKSRQPVPIQIRRRNPAWSMESAQERSLFYLFLSLSPWLIFLKAVLGLNQRYLTTKYPGTEKQSKIRSRTGQELLGIVSIKSKIELNRLVNSKNWEGPVSSLLVN